jgi:hypothetical protein
MKKHDADLVGDVMELKDVSSCGVWTCHDGHAQLLDEESAWLCSVD